MRLLSIKVIAGQSKVDQIVNAVVNDIKNDLLKKGSLLPSINVFSREQKVSRDTVDKAYRRLKISGYLISVPGRGFFVNGVEVLNCRILLAVSKLGIEEELFYTSLVKGLGGKAMIDLLCYDNNPEIFTEIISHKLGQYNYYILDPGAKSRLFSCKKKSGFFRTLQSIPAHELMLINRNLAEIGKHHMGVFRAGGTDVCNALRKLHIAESKYKKIILICRTGNHDYMEIYYGAAKFSRLSGLALTVIDHAEQHCLRPYTLYFVHDDPDLAGLLHLTINSPYRIGRQVGIVSFSTDSVFKKLFSISVITTDFEEMGNAASKLIATGNGKQIKQSLKIISRHSA